MSPNAGDGRVAGSQPMSTAVHAHGAQIKFEDLTPYLTYDCTTDVAKGICTTLRANFFLRFTYFLTLLSHGVFSLRH
jgi:hypothetical protein